MSNYTWTTIKETPDWIVDYDQNKKRYRISYFEDGHFKDEIIFREATLVVDDTIVECPHCLVCSIKLSAEELAAVEAGQQMVEVCQVCGKEVIFNG